jgi:hypothetical protein
MNKRYSQPKNGGPCYDWKNVVMPNRGRIILDTSVLLAESDYGEFLTVVLNTLENGGSRYYTTKLLLDEYNVAKQSFKGSAKKCSRIRSTYTKVKKLYSFLERNVMPDIYLEGDDSVIRENFASTNKGEIHEADVELIHGATSLAEAGQLVFICTNDGGIKKASGKIMYESNESVSNLFWLSHYNRFRSARGYWEQELAKQAAVRN